MLYIIYLFILFANPHVPLASKLLQSRSIIVFIAVFLVPRRVYTLGRYSIPVFVGQIVLSNHVDIEYYVI